jgi:release factor glutamine methyltransferase
MFPVPTWALEYLQRDTFTFESPLSYDGGADGMDLLRHAAAEGRSLLRPGGALLLELGGDQADQLVPHLQLLGYKEITVLFDDEGDLCGIEATGPMM